MITPCTFPKFRAFDRNGLPLAGGKLYSYAAGTSAPEPTFTNHTGAAMQSNPVILDINGEAEVWLGAVAYKLVLTDAADVVQWTIDYLDDQGDIEAAQADLADIKNLLLHQSGPLADRPSPPAIYGNPTDGLLYFATDESKLYRWNGGAWMDAASGRTVFVANVPVWGYAAVNGGDLQSVVIPANTLKVGDLVEITAGMQSGNHAGVMPGASVLFGDASVASFTFPETIESAVLRAYGLVTAAAAEQFFGDNFFAPGTSAIVNAAMATNADITIKSNTIAPMAGQVCSQFLIVRIIRAQ